MAEPELIASATEAPPKPIPETAPKGRERNLLRTPKGVVNEGLRRYQEARRAGQAPPTWSKQTLMECVNKALRQRNGAKLAELAESIVDNAIKGNSACLSFLAERLAPIEEKQGGMQRVWEGVKLEVVSSSLGPAGSSKTSIALVRGSESHSGSTPLNAADISHTESVQEPRDSVILEQMDVRSPETPG